MDTATNQVNTPIDPLVKRQKGIEISKAILLDLADYFGDLLIHALDEIEIHIRHEYEELAKIRSPNVPHLIHDEIHHHSHDSRNSIVELTKKYPNDFKFINKHKNYEIYQLEVLTQRDRVSCGYHSFHNAHVAMKASVAKTEEKAQEFLKKIKNPASYSFRARLVFKMLDEKTKAEGNENYPWQDKVLNSGIMERPYMTYLIEQCEYAAHLGGKATFISLPDMCINSVKNHVIEPKVILELQELFENFQKRENYSHSFLLGVTNHWVSAVAIKLAGKLELVLMDSRNNDILNATEEELKKIVKEHYDEREKAGTVIDHRAWREKIYAQSMKDTQECLEIIFKCISGQLHFVQFYLRIAHESMLSDFQENVIEKVKSDDDFVPFIYQWLTSTWPPRMIEAALTRTKLVGLNYLPLEIRKQLLEWASFVQKKVNEETVTMDVVKRFLKVLKLYEETLGNIAAL